MTRPPIVNRPLTAQMAYMAKLKRMSSSRLNSLHQRTFGWSEFNPYEERYAMISRLYSHQFPSTSTFEDDAQAFADSHAKLLPRLKAALNPPKRLDDAVIHLIRRLFHDGETIPFIAAATNVKEQKCRNIVHRREFASVISPIG